MNSFIRLFSTFALLGLAHFSMADRAGFTDRLIVKMKTQPSSSIKSSSSVQIPTLTNRKLSALSNSFGRSLKYSHALKSTRAHVVQLDGFTPVEEVKQLAEKIMAADSDVEYAEPDYLKFPSVVLPIDYYFSENHWHLKSLAVQGLNLPDAWEHTKGSSEVVVAVVDSGILASHEDFDANRILPGYDFVSQDSDELVTFIRANDGDGWDSDPTDPGDWVTSSDSSDYGSPLYGCNVRNSSWHGTHVAGTIGAASNNNRGVTGVDWTSKILPVRALGKCGGYTSDIIAGIVWAAGGAIEGVPINGNPADIINLSLGGSGVCLESEQEAIDLARSAGATIVVAAGNESDAASGYSPANCDNVIVVGAHDNQGHLSDFSNYGSEVDVLAPGGSNTAISCDNSILSLSNTGLQSPVADDYRCNIGTSMAAPHVSGLVALMLSRNPNLTPDQIETLLKSSARSFPSYSGCFGSNCGAGIADASAAIVASAVPYAPTGLIAQNNQGRVELAWQDNSELETGFKIEYAEAGQGFQELFTTIAGVTSYTHSNILDGEISYRVSAVNSGFSSMSSLEQSVTVPFKTITSLRGLQEGSSIKLSWKDNSTLETGVEIYRAHNQNAFELLTTADQNTTTYTDNDVLDGTFYQYKARAIKIDEQSDFVETQQIEVGLLAPSILQGVMEGGLLTLTWQDNSANESAYQVQRSTDGKSYSVIATLAKNTERYTETNDQTVSYYYRVVALSDKEGARSLLNEPVKDSGYSNQMVIQRKSAGGSGALSVFYVLVLFALSVYRRREY